MGSCASVDDNFRDISTQPNETGCKEKQKRYSPQNRMGSSASVNKGNEKTETRNVNEHNVKGNAGGVPKGMSGGVPKGMSGGVPEGNFEKLKDALKDIERNNHDVDKSFLLLQNIMEYQVKLKMDPDQASKEEENEGRPFFDIAANQKKLSEQRKEKQTLLIKVSEIAGARLKNNNPAIADLSDQNRPSKLAEKFSELYDNEWTDSAEELKELFIKFKRMNDEAADKALINLLCTIATKTFEWCTDTGKEMSTSFLKVALQLDDPNENVPAEMKKRCKDHVREQYEKNKSVVEKTVFLSVVDQELSTLNLPARSRNEEKYKHFTSFCKICISLCWLMVLQDPPVHMVWDGSKGALFRPYTRVGDFVEYIVWPSLLLFEGGPVLYKGVAQFCKKKNKEVLNQNNHVDSKSVDRDKKKHNEVKDAKGKTTLNEV